MSPIDALSKQDQTWMAYVDAEVAAVCRAKGWRRQIRRKWTIRETPLSRSGIDDYEWKLIPGEREASDAAGEESAVSEHPSAIDEGTYFVLGLVSSKHMFVLQHSTFHGGEMGDHFFTRTFTEIDLGPLSGSLSEDDTADVNPSRGSRGLPPSGLLQRFLLSLVDEFRPNVFSIT